MMDTGKIDIYGKLFQIPQQTLVAEMGIDTAICCKIEKGKQCARKEHIYIPIIAEISQADTEELLTIWLADKVTAVVTKDELASKVLDF